MSIPQDFNISIQIVKGGFVLHYPSKDEADGMRFYVQEVFTSTRKMHQKIKEVLEYTSTVQVDAE
jgi:hypothetical protein